MEQENKSSKKPVSFEFIGPSRAIQKKIQIGKKGAAVAAQEFPPTFDLEKLKEYRKKTGPAPKLFMPTDQDKEEAEKEASQLSQEQSRAEVSSYKKSRNCCFLAKKPPFYLLKNIFLKRLCTCRDFKNIFLDHFSPSFLGQK